MHSKTAGRFKHDCSSEIPAHFSLLVRNLLYTGVTRGKRLVVIIVQPKALAIAVRNVRSQHRLTNLAERLRSRTV